MTHTAAHASTSVTNFGDGNSERLVNRLASEPCALSFSGQGFPWLPTVRQGLTGGVARQLEAVVQDANDILAPLADDLAAARPFGFEPIEWAKKSADPHFDLSAAVISTPGIVLAQYAIIEQLRAQGLDVDKAVAYIGHSQGALATYIANGSQAPATVLAIAQLIGVAITKIARTKGLIRQADGAPMVSYGDVTAEAVEQAIVRAGVDSTIGLRNTRTSFVVVGTPADNAKVTETLNRMAEVDRKAVEDKKRGGTPLDPKVNPLDVQCAYHDPLMEEAVELTLKWAKIAGIDADFARSAARAVLVDPVDWPAECSKAAAAGALWILECGPGEGMTALTRTNVAGYGIGVVNVSANEGQAALFDAGHAPSRPTPYTAYAPQLRTIAGAQRLITRFTALTGYSPVMLPGMTPTTVDPAIVAAAANAGFWAELAGGGQATEAILESNLERLQKLLGPGINAQFNAMYLSPKQWREQIEGKRAIPRARANGAPINGVVCSAGVPPKDEAVALVEQLIADNIPWVAFKPGNQRQISQVLAIADAVAPTPIIVQIEGGKAGGHHSWEDLDDLLIATYEDIRERDNVVLAVGGGIGKPARGADYLTGTWAHDFGLPAMPVDAIMVGTAAMATKESTASASVKQALVHTPGVTGDGWVGAGESRDGMASGRSQLGADIHEIDNTFARAGRLLDEVAGDAEAVAARREEIIAAIAGTAKPYFGDIEDMTYTQWLQRYLDVSYMGSWIDASWYQRFEGMVERAEARLNPTDHGTFTAQVSVDSTEPERAIADLVAVYPAASELTVTRADAAWFIDLLHGAGKPPAFVPVIDQDVRRWWRQDSLWQAHDERYNADQVSIIPGTTAVAGIEKVDEPVAELLARFEAAAVSAVLESNDNTTASLEAPATALERVIAAPSVEWAGRQRRNPLHQLGTTWQIAADGITAMRTRTGWDPAIPTVSAIPGAVAEQIDDNHVQLTVDMPGSTAGAQLKLLITVPEGTTAAVSPLITADDAEAAMAELARFAAGGELPTVTRGTTTWTTTLSAADVADYAGVTTGYVADADSNSAIAPDLLVGRAWPAVFSVIRSATVGGDDTVSVVEGLLNLVHLEHNLVLTTPMAELTKAGEVKLSITATANKVHDTALGRVVEVSVEITKAGTDTLVATLDERFAIVGRKGDSVYEPYASAAKVTDTPTSFRHHLRVTAPQDMRAFAMVTGDRNPIHVAADAARLAGLPEGVIVHGMWTSAVAQLAARFDGAEIAEWSASMLSPVLPGSIIDFIVERTGIAGGEVRTITATVDGENVLQATARMAAPRTFYGFPGQGIQSQGMGMESYASSAAAREIWERADRHTRTKLGFSILDIVRNNPPEVVVGGETFQHPDGALFLTQFTQVAMATLGCAQIAEMAEAGVLSDDTYFAGHSVGEYNALAAYAQVLSLEAVVEIVYRRGLTMHRLVDRDADGHSNYGLAALRPNKIGISADNVFGYVEEISQRTGEFLEIVNYNIAGVQYAVAGTRAGLAALAADAEGRAPGARSFIMIPGIDVPFHSSHLLGGVGDFRDHLSALIPADLNLDILIGRYIPNLVARPFELSEEFVQAIAKVVDSPFINDILADFAQAKSDPARLGRTLLIELLAWQFASPVRWIETQDLLLSSPLETAGAGTPGLGVERFVEIGVGSSPTLANMLGQTLRLPQYAGNRIEVLNIERDRPTVFAEDTVERPDIQPAAAPNSEAPVAAAGADAQVEVDSSAADAPAAVEAAAPAASAPAPVAAPAAGAGTPDDKPFTPADATEMLVALWTKVRPDQIGAADTIELLVEGVSSRRNQLLLDLGVEFGLGAIDGAADAEIDDLKQTVAGMAKGYKAFGPVLSVQVADALRRLTGPAGKKPGYIAERISDVWALGAGWVDRVTAELVLGTRDGASLRGGDLAYVEPAAPASAAQLDELIDAAVTAAGVRAGVNIAKPQQGGATGGVVDSAALGEFADSINQTLTETARTLLRQLGHDVPTTDFSEPDENAAIAELVTRELGADWPRLVAPKFDANKAVLLDDRWASAREDVVRYALGQLDTLDVTGTGAEVAKIANYYGLTDLAEQALVDPASLEAAGDVAVVTGGSPNSIAAAVAGRLLAQGATVVATTSSLSHDRLEYYKELYRTHARGAAALWVVPANLSSFADLDALIEWIGSEQTATVGGSSKLVKPALVPTMLFPFAAPRVQGTLADAGAAAESQMRLLLWSVEKLIAGLSALGSGTHVGQRLHVVIPGSPNRGRFGGDGAYGESKAALDALVTRWHAEPVWANRTSLVHAHIGWVRGTGLMGGNDPLVEAVEAKGVATYSTEEMAAMLLEQGASASARAEAAQSPKTLDFTGGLGDADIDLPALARELADATFATAESSASRELKALPNIRTPYQWTTPDFSNVRANLDDMVVIVGAGELGPAGSSRTRYEVEMTGELSAAGVMELAWSTGLITWDDAAGAWFDADEQEIAEEDIYDRFHDQVLAGLGVRRYHDDYAAHLRMVDNLAPELTTIYLEKDMTFAVADEEAARSFVADVDGATAYFDGEEWQVTRPAGSAVRVPRRVAMSRFVGGQIPEGFDPGVYGIPADMIDNLDRVALWNLVCTVDAFLSAGFSPAELLSRVHPARVSSTQGTGMGGMQSLRSLYVDKLLAQPRPNDILQEALPNVVAAHVMQSYVGGYGQMVHPVAACATAAVSVEEGMDKLRLRKADFVVAGGIDDLSIEGITGFGDMAATADSKEMEEKGIEHKYFSRANDRRRGGFIESEGGGTILLARGTLAAELGLPVLGVVAFAESFADGAHTSIPAPGLGALSAARGGVQSRLAQSLEELGVAPDEISVISKHDTSTNANDPNESDLHERVASALGRREGNPLFVVSQKTITGHAKGGAAAFQMVGLTQVLREGVIPPNRALDCVDPVLRHHEHLTWLRRSLDLKAQPPKAGLVTSLGFGHVSALVAIVHPGAFVAALGDAAAAWRTAAHSREVAGLRKLSDALTGGPSLYERPVDRNLGGNGAAVKEREAAVLLSDASRLSRGILEPNAAEK